jgi:hypothetical protein
LPSRTSHSPLSSPITSKNRRCSMLLTTRDVAAAPLPHGAYPPMQDNPAL